MCCLEVGWGVPGNEHSLTYLAGSTSVTSAGHWSSRHRPQWCTVACMCRIVAWHKLLLFHGGLSRSEARPTTELHRGLFPQVPVLHGERCFCFSSPRKKTQPFEHSGRLMSVCSRLRSLILSFAHKLLPAASLPFAFPPTCITLAL
jgi:hypothetical protein